MYSKSKMTMIKKIGCEPFIIEICFFSLLTYVKSTLKYRLTSDVLNAFMKMKLSAPPLAQFHDKLIVNVLIIGVEQKIEG